MAWVTFERRQFKILDGEPQSYRSSPDVLREFCGTCGSAISYESDQYPNIVDLTTLSLDDPNAFSPTRETWLEHKMPWEAVNSGLGQYPRGTTDGEHPE